jgi:hypothetical protein
MTTQDLLPLLKAHDTQLRRTPLRRAADARNRRSLRELPPTSTAARSWFGLVLGASAGAVLLAIAVGRSGPSAPAPTLAPRASLSAHPECEVLENGGAVDYLGGCSVKLPTLSVRTEPGSVLKRRDLALELVRGSAWFEVRPLPAGAPPVRVRVAGGVIEVVGTVFSVKQGYSEGSVELFEGKIRFLSAEREAIELRPGEQFVWANSQRRAGASPGPTLAPSAQSSASLADAASASRLPPPPLGRLAPSARNQPSPAPSASQALAVSAIERIAGLRALGKYQEALAELSAVQQRNRDMRTAEVLSFERGTLLERLGGATLSCPHWSSHAAQFPKGMYHAAISAKLVAVCAAIPAAAGTSSAKPGNIAAPDG